MFIKSNKIADEVIYIQFFVKFEEVLEPIIISDFSCVAKEPKFIVYNL